MPLVESLDTPAVNYLRQAGASFKIFQHNAPVDSLQAAAAERGQAPDQLIRSILFRLPRGQFVLVLMPGERQISWKSLRAYLGERRLTLASPTEVVQQTGCEVGTVTPLGLPHPLRILADPAVFASPEISLGSGKKGFALILQAHQLRILLPNLEITPLNE